jgi:hypothetical protein
MIRLSLAVEWLDIHYQIEQCTVTYATNLLLAAHQALPFRMTPEK